MDATRIFAHLRFTLLLEIRRTIEQIARGLLCVAHSWYLSLVLHVRVVIRLGLLDPCTVDSCRLLVCYYHTLYSFLLSFPGDCNVLLRAPEEEKNARLVSVLAGLVWLFDFLCS